MTLPHPAKPRLRHILLFSSLAAIRASSLAVSVGICMAETGSIDWVQRVSDPLCSASWVFDGLRVTNARGTICLTNSSSVSNGTTTCNDLAGMVVEHMNGLPFTPQSVDLGEYSTTTSDSVIHFIGYKQDGATVTTSFQIDRLADGSGGIDDFQRFSFPLEFSDVLRLEVPNTLWHCDNLIFSTVIPPPLPSDQKLGPAYESAEIVYSKSIHDDTLILGSDFQLVSGFRPYFPTSTKFIAPEGGAFLSGTSGAWYDRADQALYFKQTHSTAIKKYKAGVTTNVADLQDPLSLGITVTSVSKARSASGRLLFMGVDLSGGDSYYIFEKRNGVTTALVTPSTQLPTGSSSSTPYYFPNDIAIHADGFAFDTSLDGSTSRWRLYASFNDGPIQYIIGVTDPVSSGEAYQTVLSLGVFEFTSTGELRVRASLNEGEAWLYFSKVGFLRLEWIMADVTPVNAGKQVRGELFKTISGVTFMDTHEEVFREYNGGFYRVLGVGDKILGETVSYLEFKTARENPPLRALVEVRYESSAGTARILELQLDPPVILPPRFGGTFVHPESGDLFVPLSHLTHGREYWLRGSVNLSEWTDLWKIEQIFPLQHVVVPATLLASPSFYRVEQR